MTDEPILRVKGLTKQFGGLVAVDRVSFEQAPGTILAVIGPNGAGKTTLFNLITGVEPPTSGELTFSGQRVEGLKASQRAVMGMARTFQTPQIFQNMSVLENVLVGRHRHGRAGFLAGLLSTPGSRREDRNMREYCMHLLSRLGLADKADEEAGAMAFGQAKFLEIARALATEPKMVLLDEFAAGLTAGETDELSAVVEIMRDEGVTVLLVEHDMRLVMNLSERIVVLNFGEKIAEGSPSEIQRNPEVIKVYLGTE